MRVVLISLFAMLGCHTAPIGVTAEPDGALSAIPADPGLVASPYDAALPVPRLAHRAPDLDLEALAQRYTVYHVDIDLSGIRRLTNADAQRVQLALAADPRWRVGVWDGAVVAFQRARTETGWAVPRHGFHTDDGGVWRTGVRFSDWSTASEWSTSDAVSRSDASSRKLALRAFSLLRGPAAGLEVTALTVSAPALAMELFEATADRTRPRTSEALSTLPTLIEQLHDPRVAISTWDPGKADAPSVRVTASEAGQIEIAARVAIDRPGWTWVRLLDQRGRVWEEAAVTAGTRELMWGDAGTPRSAWLQSELPVPSGDAFRGTAEIWQAPLAGGQPALIATHRVEVPARWRPIPSSATVAANSKP